MECLALSQLCLWSQGREAGRGRQAGCSGPEPGHTLCHAAQEKPRPETDRGFRGEPKSTHPQRNFNRPQGAHCAPSSTTWHTWSPKPGEDSFTLALCCGCGATNQSAVYPELEWPGVHYTDTGVNTGTKINIVFGFKAEYRKWKLRIMGDN